MGSSDKLLSWIVGIFAVVAIAIAALGFNYYACIQKRYVERGYVQRQIQGSTSVYWTKPDSLQNPYHEQMECDIKHFERNK